MAFSCSFLALTKLTGFMEFPQIPGDEGELMRIYFTSGFLKITGVLEILGGVALLLNKYVPLAQTVLVAIIFNAVLFHAFHATSGIGGALVALVLGLVLVVANKDRFSGILSV